MNIGFISLGCSKNLVDTEMMIGLFKKYKYNIVSNPKDADIIIVNTCGFIDSAKKEAIDTFSYAFICANRTLKIWRLQILYYT